MVGLLQNLYRASADKVFHKLTQLYYYERKVQSGGVSPATYKSHAQELLHRSGKEVCTLMVESMKWRAYHHVYQDFVPGLCLCGLTSFKLCSVNVYLQGIELMTHVNPLFSDRW